MPDAPTEGVSFFDRCRNRSPMFWLFIALLLSLNGLYDYYNPRGIVSDVIVVIVSTTSRRRLARSL
jgi:hypothetical protein